MYTRCPTNPAQVLQEYGYLQKPDGTFVKFRPKPKPKKKQIKPRKYKEYIKSPDWLKTKRRVLGTKPICAACGSTQYIHAHHTNYKHVGRETTEDLVALCSSCHNSFHEHVPTRTDMTEDTKHFVQAKQYEKELSTVSHLALQHSGGIL
jgi:5-methylcytosine-specific restriction endonuclease McrA